VSAITEFQIFFSARKKNPDVRERNSRIISGCFSKMLAREIGEPEPEIAERIGAV
jgi:hypothetical protein